MSSQLKRLISGAPVTVPELRERLGLFSFQDEVRPVQSAAENGSLPELGIRPGGIVEWLVARHGAGAVTSALQIVSQSSAGRGVWVVVDPARECYVPAFSGWGVDPSRILLVRPATLEETIWAIEQCLRCPGVSATWAWVDQRIPAQVHRRWQMAAEVGGGVGLFFRPVWARREPIWADLRLLVTPRAGGQMETRRVHIEVLYRRGGRGGSAQAWEIDHAAGNVRLVPKVADPATAERAARA
jgi:protein ImuA